jgi:predicted nucleic acid-binding protein
VSGYLLDACALLALFNGEKGDDAVDNLLQQAEDGQIVLYMHIAQLLEVYYDRLYLMDMALVKEIIESILAFPITIIDQITYPIFYEAGRLKSTYSVSFADSIALATARSLSYTLVTSDHHEFDELEKKEPINFFWIR